MKILKVTKENEHYYSLDFIRGYNLGAKQQAEIMPERKKGKWIRNDNGTYYCSVCQSWLPEEQHHYARYCLYCGADMRGEQDDS